MLRNKMSDAEEEAFEKARAILSEHFPNWTIVVIDETDSLKYDYTNYYIGKTLCRETVAEMNKDDIDMIIWEDAEVDDEEDNGI